MPGMSGIDLKQLFAQRRCPIDCLERALKP
jgi:hypothetical protein